MIHSGREFNFSSISRIWNNTRERRKRKPKDLSEEYRSERKRKKCIVVVVTGLYFSDPFWLQVAKLYLNLPGQKETLLERY